MGYETVIWDWNGTLLDDVDLALGIVNDILRDHNLEGLDKKRYQEIFDFPVQLYYERAGMDFTEVQFEAISDRYCRLFEENIHSAGLFKDAEAALTTIAELGIPQFLLSSTEHESLTRMVSALGVAPTFHDIRGMPDGLARGKAQVGGLLVESHEIDPAKAVMLGDTRHDWEVAEALGMECLLVATGHQSFERLSSVGCPVFESVTEAVSYLRS